jgi:dTDP-4-dehydrorhamnose reductase
MNKILVTGASGLVGSRFVELCSGKYQLLTPDYTELDITNRQNVKDYLEKHKPDVIINFAAYTNVSEAQKQKGDQAGDCWKINVEGVKNLIGNCFLIHISTDMVFSGANGPYKETDTPETDPEKLTWYGFTKAEGERVAKDKATIVRIIYPVRKKYDLKLDYLKKPLSLYEQNKLYPLFVDQQINITYIDEIGEVLENIIEGKLPGVYHVASRDLTTPHELISYYISKVKGIDFVAQPGNIDPARYPKYGGLDTKFTQEKLGIKFSSWREIVAKT